MARNVSTGRKIGTTVLAWFVGLVIFFPILWTFLTSFKTELQAISIPPVFVGFDWTLENYQTIQILFVTMPKRLMKAKIQGIHHTIAQVYRI